tara:strand:- start:408 stop:923 length:516 start_codon:yes stop_codon:yes gene_type:complete
MMSIFYRGRSGKTQARSPAMMKWATSIALLAYPAGCLIQLLFPDTTERPDLRFGEAAGLILVATSLFAFATFAASSFQRIVGEETDKLDEFEMELRRKAHAFSYQVFASLTLLFIIYLGISSDLLDSDRLTLWHPQTYNHWNALFWGATLYALVLPTAYLAWTMPAAPEDE